MKVLDSQLSVQGMQIRADSAEGFALDVQLATLPEVMARQIEVLEQSREKSGTSRGKIM